MSFFVKKKKDHPTANSTMPDKNDSSSTYSHVAALVTTDDNEPAAVTELGSTVNTSKSPCFDTRQGIVPNSWIQCFN